MKTTATPIIAIITNVKMVAIVPMMEPKILVNIEDARLLTSRLYDSLFGGTILSLLLD